MIEEDDKQNPKQGNRKMSEIKKLVKGIEKEIENIEKTGGKYNTRWIQLKAKLKGIKEGLEALKKDLIKNKPCPNKYPLISACYEQVIDDINKILGGEK